MKGHTDEGHHVAHDGCGVLGEHGPHGGVGGEHQLVEEVALLCVRLAAELTA